MKKFLMTVGAASLALIMGLASCNKADQEVGPIEEDGSTYVAVSLSFPAETRALPDDYNKVGTWEGKDKIERVDIFVVDMTTNIVSTGQFQADDFDPLTAGKLKPKKAIKTKPGNKKIYALVNGTDEIVSKLALSDATQFEKAYTDAAVALANSGISKTVSTSASKIAKYDNAKGDIIVMTNSEASTLLVADNVKEAEAIAGTKNFGHVTVARAAARVIVTTKAKTYEVKRPITGEKIGTVSEVKWVLAQGENSFFIQGKPAPDFKTPKFDYKPDASNYYTKSDVGYDYSGLWEGYQAPDSKKIGGTEVPDLATYAPGNMGSIKLSDNAKNSKFILPTNHKIGPDKVKSGFVKGNTAYVLVRAKFTPEKFADGTVYKDGDDFFLGANGKFYGSKANAQDKTKGGVAGQKVAKYVGGKVLYYAWVNPDNVETPFNSPVLRNHIYHIHIKGFKNIGTNWNPLVPGDDPNNPGDDDNNPDPKPKDNPDEPENPIKPDDPLSTPETWMSVDITVLPWQVHSYEIDLSI